MAPRAFKPSARRALAFHVALGFGVTLLGLGRQYLQMQRGLNASLPKSRDAAALRDLLLSGRESAPVKKTQMFARGWGRRSATLKELPPTQQPEEASMLANVLMLAGVGSILTSVFLLTSPAFRTRAMAGLPTPPAEIVRDQSQQLQQATKPALVAVRLKSQEAANTFTRLEVALEKAEAQAEVKVGELKPQVKQLRETMHQMDHNLHMAAAEAGNAAKAMQNTLANGKQHIVQNFNAAKPQLQKTLREAYLAAKAQFEQGHKGLTAAYSEADAALQKGVADALPGAMPAIHEAAANVERGIDVMTAAGVRMVEAASAPAVVAGAAFVGTVRSQIEKFESKAEKSKLAASVQGTTPSSAKKIIGLKQGMNQKAATAVASVHKFDSSMTTNSAISTSHNVSKAVEASVAAAARTAAARDALKSPPTPVFSGPRHVRAEQNAQVRRLLLNFA
eukprot:TRINITY_DN9221_c0_g2_i2.p1 TRINITY_DN9221_c0_g2~~TRINITY_DN9221_c0_g2_i2.p1  ORF type:complete len:450 (-),score=116.21 TRINITY_DN9221_c0_g2_i2:283-1632(-)